MSRTGKRPIQIPHNVTVTVADDTVKVQGPKGALTQMVHPWVRLAVTPEGLSVSVQNPEIKKQKAMWGTFVSLVRGMIIGVTNGYEKKLEVNGVGYGWNLSGKKLGVKAGYSHPISIDLPEGITAKVEEQVLILSSISKQQVGEFAAQIRKIRPPEPYKGKGIKYVDEHIRRKAGKQAATAGKA